MRSNGSGNATVKAGTSCATLSLSRGRIEQLRAVLLAGNMELVDVADEPTRRGRPNLEPLTKRKWTQFGSEVNGGATVSEGVLESCLGRVRPVTSGPFDDGRAKRVSVNTGFT
jgi:hypothetical protein